MVDVLVIGASKSGLNASISAKNDENTVLVVTKDFNTRTNKKHSLYSLQMEALNIGIKFQPEYFLLNFIVYENKILGANFIDIKTSEVETIEAKSIIIASGGYSSIYYNFNTNKNLDSGDVIASAIRVGAKFENPHLIKFKAITKKSDPHIVFPNNQSIKDFDRNSIKQSDNLANYIYKNAPKCYGIFTHIDDEDIEIMPSSEYSIGGIQTNDNGESAVNGLFVVGESASNKVDMSKSFHEDDLPNNDDLIKAVSIKASDYACLWEDEGIDISQHPQILRDKQFIDACFLFCNKIDFKKESKLFGEMLYQYMPFSNLENAFNKILKQINKLKYDYTYMGLKNKTRKYNEELIKLIEFGNIIEISEMVVLSSLIKAKKKSSSKNITLWKINKNNKLKNMAIFDYQILSSFD